MAERPGGPARDYRSPHYPAHFAGRVPKTVTTARSVCQDFPWISRATGDPVSVTDAGGSYPAWTNSHGAVAADLPNGKRLGLKPGEFEIVDWYGEGDA